METRVRLDSLKQGESFRFWGTVRTVSYTRNRFLTSRLHSARKRFMRIGRESGRNKRSTPTKTLPR